MKKIGIFLITKNRYLAVKEYLYNILDECKINNIDIVIVDSSENDDIFDLVKNFNALNIIYLRYLDNVKVSIDKKVIWVVKKFFNEYEYMWFSSDGVIPNIKKLTQELDENLDLLVYDNEHKYICEYIYVPNLLLKKYCWRMTMLSSCIVSSKLLKNSLKFYKENNNLGFWLPMIYFYYYAINNKCFVKFVGDKNLWEKNRYIRPSFWLVSGNLLWQWGKIWVESIEALPKIYEKEKQETILSHDKNMKLFSIKKLISVQEWGNISLKKIKKYKNYIAKITDTNIFVFYFVTIFYKSCFIKWIKNLLKKR